MRFKYLCVNVTSNRYLQPELSKQKMEGTIISGYLKDTVWKNEYRITDIKIRKYKTTMKPMMMEHSPAQTLEKLNEF